MKKFSVEEIERMPRSTRSYYRSKGYEIPKGRPGPKVGFKQSPEHVVARVRTGPEHHAWLGDKASESAGRARALREYPTIGPCLACGSLKSERHHVDGDTLNNSPGNIAPLCRRCHMRLDGRLDELKNLARNNRAKLVAARRG